MLHHQKWTASSLEQLVFRFAIAVLKADQSTSAIEHRLALTVHYFIVVTCVCNFKTMFGLDPATWITVVNPILALLTIATFAYAVLLGYCLVRYPNITLTDQTPPCIYVAARMGIFSRYILFPYSVWAFFTALFSTQMSLVWIIVGLATLFVAAIEALANILLVCNTLPSKSVNAAYSHDHQIHVYLAMLSASILGLRAQYTHNHSAQLVLLWLVILILTGVLLYYVFNQSFWHKSTNLWILILQCFVLIGAIWSLTSRYGYNLDKSVPELLVAFSLSIRFSINCSNLPKQVDPFKNGISPKSQVYGLTNFERLLARKWRGTLLHKYDLEALSYYQNLLRAHFANSDSIYLRGLTAETVLSDSRCFYKWIVNHILQHRMDCELLILCLKLHLIHPFDNLSIVLQLMARLESMSRFSIKARIEFYQLKSLYETKIDAFYRLGEDDSALCLSLENQYQNIILRSNRRTEQSHADIETPLEHKRLFELMHKTIGDIVQRRMDIFNYVKHSRIKSNSVDGVQLMRLNETAKKEVEDFDGFLKSKILSIRLLPTHFFGMLKVYYRLLKNDGYQARRILYQYHISRAMWDLKRGRQQQLGVDSPDNRTAILHIDIQSGSSGTIIDISTHAERVLGLPQDGQIVGNNINDLFVEAISKYHQELMANSSGFGSLLNAKKDFFISNFNGKLQEISFLLKLLPHIGRDVVVVAALDPRIKVQNLLLLLDKKGNILEAEEGFWVTAGILSTEEQARVSHIRQITRKLELMVDFVKAAKCILEVIKSGKVDIEVGSTLQDLCRFLQRVVALNDYQKILYSIDADSPLHQKLQISKLSCRVDPYLFNNEIELTKLYLNFSSKDASATQLVNFATNVQSAEASHEDRSRKTGNKDGVDNSNKVRKWSYSSGEAGGQNTPKQLQASYLDCEFDNENYQQQHDTNNVQDINVDAYYSASWILQQLAQTMRHFSEESLGYFSGPFKQGLLSLSQVRHSVVQELKVKQAARSSEAPSIERGGQSNTHLMIIQSSEKMIIKKRPELPDMLTPRGISSFQNLPKASQASLGEIKLGFSSHSKIFVGTQNKLDKKSEFLHGKLIADETVRAEKETNYSPGSTTNQFLFKKIKTGQSKVNHATPITKKGHPNKQKQSPTKSNMIVKEVGDVQENEGSLVSTKLDDMKVSRVVKENRYSGRNSVVFLSLLYGLISLVSWWVFELEMRQYIGISDSVHMKTNAIHRVSFRIISGIWVLLESRNARMSRTLPLSAATRSVIANCCTSNKSNNIQRLLPRYLGDSFTDINAAAHEFWDATMDDSLSKALGSNEPLFQKMNTNLTTLPEQKLAFMEIMMGYVNGLQTGRDLLLWSYTAYYTASAEMIALKDQQQATLEQYLINDAYFSIMLGLGDLIKSSRQTLQFSVEQNMANDFYLLLIATSFFIILNTIASGMVTWRINKRMRSILESYVFLREEDMIFETTRLNQILAFQKEHKYNAERKMEEARALERFQRVQVNSSPSFENSLARKQRVARKNILPELASGQNVKVFDIKNMMNSKLKLSRPFRSLTEIIALTLLLVLLLGTVMMLMNTVHGKVLSIAELRLNFMLGGELIQDMHRRFAMLTVVSPFVLSFNSSIAETAVQFITEDGYRQSLSTFTQLFQSEAEVGREDLCANIKHRYNASNTAADREMCQELAFGFASQSILKYFIYEQGQYSAYVEIFRPFYSNAASTGKNLTALTSMMEIWYSQAALSLRLAHHTVFTYAFDFLASRFEQKVLLRKRSTSNTMTILRAIGILIVLLPLLLMLTHALHLLRCDWKWCLHTFEVLSPETIQANQYVLVKFKQQLRR